MRVLTSASPRFFAIAECATGRIGMEERVRFFLFDGIRKAAPGFQFVSADSDHRGLPHVQIAR